MRFPWITQQTPVSPQVPLPEGGERSGREGAVRTAAEVGNAEGAKLLALMLAGRDHEPKNGGYLMDFSRQPLGASAAHTFTAAWGWLGLLAQD